MDTGLEGRVVIVTGASQGIGKAAALAFARERAHVVVTYRDNRELAESVVSEVDRVGAQGMALRAELAEPASWYAVAKAVFERWGRIDVLVNNAVQWPARPPWEAPAFEDVPEEEWKSCLFTNLEGAYAAIQAVLPAMREKNWGRIINVSSGIAVDGFVGAGAYAAAKAGLHGLTRTLCKELGPAGILVNVVMPGLTLTERIAPRLPAARRMEMERASPIRRLLTPEEVVPTIVFLGSAINTAVTGEVIRASGGIT